MKATRKEVRGGAPNPDLRGQDFSQGELKFKPRSQGCLTYVRCGRDCLAGPSSTVFKSGVRLRFPASPVTELYVNGLQMGVNKHPFQAGSMFFAHSPAECRGLQSPPGKNRTTRPEEPGSLNHHEEGLPTKWEYSQEFLHT